MNRKDNAARKLNLRAPNPETPLKRSSDKASYPLSLNDVSLDVGVYHAPERSRDVRHSSSSVAWFLSEFILGPLFLVVTHAYTFVIPSSIASTSDIRLSFEKLFKRFLDIFGSVVGLVLATPIFIIIPILIKLNSRGPVFYTQVRVGKNKRTRSRRAYNVAVDNSNRRRDRRREDVLGRPFKVIKFRTMVVDAEKDCGPVWATKGDPRITRLGRFLRKCRLDEVPQLINVLRGEMSLVGPRPERPVFVKSLADEVPNYRRRLTVKPGLTGLAQVENGYDTSVNSVVNKIKTDLRYIDNWSLMSDIKILIRTIKVVLTGDGAN
ncbi:sugar transferase [bacterium AH-315-J21]|nr:sugar transferase [bacterium AH-315-J21]